MRPSELLYDARDMTTHALCVGMTGSGKTGLCLSLLEEAGIDGIPAIAVDPKGDLGNLLLTFPDLQPGDFEPWVDAAAAQTHGKSAEAYAAETAQRWREGLAEWGQSPSRIARFREAVDLAIYTPGSSAGLPLTVLKSFEAPPAVLRDDADLFRERVAAATAGLLSLLGIDPDPVRSREYVLVSNLLYHAWSQGKSLDLPALIREIQEPSIDRIGVLPLEDVYSAKDRRKLAMTFNGLLASPSFAGWLEGEALDIQRLLYTDAGKPRISIISIAHLSDTERMFFMTILLNELIAWMRRQPGTPSLRALFYMDEVFGYFPPVAEPPTKRPMLTLLKQARAFGLGIVLATQNPVDLDYRGLSNCGTWFLGRLQTQRDKERVLAGLEGANAEAGVSFDRDAIDRILSRLDSRIFLMNNVHEDEPVVFQTRWVLSYLRGPLTRDQIRSLMEPIKSKSSSPSQKETASSAPVPEPQPATTPEDNQRPAIPSDVFESFWEPTVPAHPGEKLVYRPAIAARARLHYVRVSYHIDEWISVGAWRLGIEPLTADLWDEGHTESAPDWKETTDPLEDVPFADLPSAMRTARNYTRWQKKLRDHLYQHEKRTVWKCSALKSYSDLGESEADFRIRLGMTAREERDRRLAAVQEKFRTRMEKLKTRWRRARDRVEREKSQYQQKTVETVVTAGSAIWRLLFGRRRGSRPSTAVRRAGQAVRERADIRRAQEEADEIAARIKALEEDVEREIESIEDMWRPDQLVLEPLVLRPRKSDIAFEQFGLAWTPWWRAEEGTLRRAW